eukprot:GILI01059981.1.p1 GENE.GILI01059981.1~~GILI01059981.1.p1  ORF type:complete len:138 (+),score=9.21 GILI01059981.1:39-452(+)
MDTKCLKCSFFEATASSQSEVLNSEIIPTVDELLETCLRQRVELDRAALEHRRDQSALRCTMDAQTAELRDAKDEVEDLRAQLNSMTEMMLRLQPAIQLASHYKKALREARASLERIKGETSAADSILLSVNDALSR